MICCFWSWMYDNVSIVIHCTKSVILSHNNLHYKTQVLWAEEQSTKQRQKRDLIEIDPSDIPKERVKRVSTEVPYSVHLNDTSSEKLNKTRSKRRAIPGEADQIFNDELWNQQWYLVSSI